MPEEIKWDAGRSGFVGARGWFLCLTLGALIVVALVGQQTQQYAHAEAAGEGDFGLAQMPTPSLNPQAEERTRYQGVETFSRRDQSWVMND